MFKFKSAPSYITAEPPSPNSNTNQISLCSLLTHHQNQTHISLKPSQLCPCSSSPVSFPKQTTTKPNHVSPCPPYQSHHPNLNHICRVSFPKPKPNQPSTTTSIPKRSWHRSLSATSPPPNTNPPPSQTAQNHAFFFTTTPNQILKFFFKSTINHSAQPVNPCYFPLPNERNKITGAGQRKNKRKNNWKEEEAPSMQLSPHHYAVQPPHHHRRRPQVVTTVVPIPGQLLAIARPHLH
jgi:hypothetical protein